MKKIFEEEDLLEANGWIYEEGRGWVDPVSIRPDSPRGIDYSRQGAIAIVRLRLRFAPLYAAGWRMPCGGGREDAPTYPGELIDPCPEPGQRRYCGLRAAEQRQKERELGPDKGAHGFPAGGVLGKRPKPARANEPTGRPPPPLRPGDEPARFQELSLYEQEAILFWIRSVMKPASTPSTVNSYGLKHFCEDEVGFYVSNGTMKGAMLAARAEPVDPHAQDARYWVRPLRPSPRQNGMGTKQTLCRRWDGREVYTITDASEATVREFLALCIAARTERTGARAAVFEGGPFDSPTA